MTTNSIKSDREEMFVSGGDGLARANDSRQKVTKIKVLNKFHHFNEILLEYNRCKFLEIFDVWQSNFQADWPLQSEYSEPSTTADREQPILPISGGLFFTQFQYLRLMPIVSFLSSPIGITLIVLTYPLTS